MYLQHLVTMKPTFVIPAIFAAMALAQPHNMNRHRHAKKFAGAAHRFEKRAITTEWVIETAWVTQTEYVDGTTTITVEPDATPASKDDKADPESGKDAQFFETPAQKPPAEPTPAPAAPEPVVNTPPPPAPTPEPVAPTPEPEPQPQPQPVTPVPAPVAQNPTPSVVAQDASSSSGNYDTSVGGNGELTFFSVGLGSCGFNDSGKDLSEYYVALSHLVMGELSNNNPLCGRTITVMANGKSVVATIRDKCGDCAANNIDGTEKLFIELFGDLGLGRMPVEWYLNAN